MDKEKLKSYVADFVYGATDGTVTTFAVVSGVAGAGLSPSIVIILGLANLFADGFSMGISSYLAGKSRREYYERLKGIEAQHIKKNPYHERALIREMFWKRGFRGSLLDKIVSKITGKKENWIDMLMSKEHGVIDESSSPLQDAVATFSAFVTIGSISLLPFIYALFRPIEHAFLLSTIFTGLTFLLVGAAKGMIVKRNVMLSALEMFFIGGIAAALSYGVGFALQGLA